MLVTDLHTSFTAMCRLHIKIGSVDYYTIVGPPRSDSATGSCLGFAGRLLWFRRNVVEELYCTLRPMA